jgi:magnesium transporter
MQDIVKYRKALERLINDGQELKILTLISRLHPDDIADLIDELEEEQKTRLFRLLDVETAADVIMELDDISRELILEDIPDDKLSEIIDDMPSDDAADFIAELPEEQAQRVLGSMDQEKSEDVQRLLEYPEDSAGGIMQTELIALDQDATVTQTIEYIRSKRDEVEGVHNVYVLGDGARLAGFLPIGNLLLADGDTLLKDIMDKQVIAAKVDMDQEEVAALFRKYDLVSVPVVDADRHVLGRILVDDIIEVIQEEDSEDMFRMAGISEEEDVVYSGATLKVCMTRLPWLVFNFFGTLISGYFLWMYQSRLTDLLALLAFVPVICAMSGNIGVQSTSIVIRGLATGRVDFSNLRRLILKESAVGLIIGLVCGMLGGVIGLLWQASWLIGIVVFVAMFVAIAFGALLGVLVPLFFKKIKIDPAVASGALIATANDLVAINIYFLFAAFMMKYVFVA